MDDKNNPWSEYRTRFAPSPTGPLHFGSLVTALGSYLQARAHQGLWLIRVEDIDPPREVPGAIRDQLKTLATFGLISDRPIVHQSERRRVHEACIERLIESGLAYWCGCSSKELPPLSPYPGTCRDGIPNGKSPRSVRFKTRGEWVEFVDGLQGPQSQQPSQETGDFIIRRGDGLMAYQLVVVVDDIHQGITEVVRGADLLSSVGRQCLLYDALGAPRPNYVHLPLVVDNNGRKLSKSDAADPIARYSPQHALRLALKVLGHEPPIGHQSVKNQLDWAHAHWNLHQVPIGPIPI